MSGSVAMARFRMTFVFGVDLGRFANDRHFESEGLSTRPSLLNHRITLEIPSRVKRLSLVVLRRQRELPRCARVAPRVAHRERARKTELANFKRSQTSRTARTLPLATHDCW